MSNIKKYQMALANVEELGAASIRKLLAYYGDEYNIWKASIEELKRSSIISDKMIYGLEQYRKSADIDKAWENMNAKNIKLVAYNDETYPSKLIDIPNPPAYLFYMGELPKENIPSVSIIGARMCTEYGKESARDIAAELASNGVQIISGLASGIDGIAQRAAVDADGKSYGLLGCGVDVCYPVSNRKIYEDLKTHGGLISENPLSSKATSYHFPMRNRLISGLSDIVIVIEAKEKSGTTITVNMALEQGRDVYALPGRYKDPLSRGCNKLIADGAGIITSVDLILSELECKGYNLDTNHINKSLEDKTIWHPIDELEKAIQKSLSISDKSIDQIYSNINANNISIEELSVKLMKLELEGYIKASFGRYYL